MTSIKRSRNIASAAALLLLATVVTGLYLGTETRRQFGEIAASWSGFAGDAEKKGVWISSLRGYLGYGGIIHTFKNYVLRQDETYRLRALEQLEHFDLVMAEYLAEPLPDAERHALLTIQATIDEYRQNLALAERSALANWPAERTDKLVKVDDTAAIAALAELETIWRDNRQSSTGRIIAAVARGDALIGVGYLSMLMLVPSALAIGLLIGLLVRDLRAAARQSDDELRARLSLERSEQRLAEAVEQSPATIIVTDTRGRINYVNRKFEVVSGWHREEVVGRTPRILQSGDLSADDYLLMRAALARGEPWHGVMRNMRKDGSHYWVDITILPLRDAEGLVHSFVGIGEDITEKRLAREQVVRSQKIEAVGLMAGGIAHDFNNILTSIIGSVHLAALDAPEGSEIAGEVDQIDIAARRAQMLVRQLLGFARREPGRPVATDLCAVIAEVERLMRAATPSTIHFALPEPCAPVPVLADPTHLHQILMNLCTNAAEAIGGADGTITVRARKLDARPDGLDDRAGGWVELEVEDTGIGLSEDARERIFDAFYTSKPLGKGTGLGLSVVQGLVQDMGGRILVDSAPGQGARFRVILPGAEAGQMEVAHTLAAPQRGHETLLVVDDQTEVAATLRRGLMRLGYQVEAYTEPQTALERFQRQPDRHRLLVSDVVMPGMNGVELARRMRALRPDLPVIFCTGFNPTGVALEGGPTVVLGKPVDAIDLGGHIRALLDPPAAV